MKVNELTFKTIDFWSRYSGESVTSEEAREIIENITGFFQILAEWDDDQNKKTDNDKQGG